MSLKRLAVISAVGSHNSFNNQTISYVSSYSGSLAEQGGSAGSPGGSGLRSGGGGGGHHQGGLHTMRPGANLHGNVNIMLGGAMLSVVITVVCFVCYCCHRNIKKRSNSLYRQQWLETEANMEIYSVEQCYDPPPSSSSGGFFMDGGSSGDYQSLPMLTTGGGSAINHNGAHLQFPYQHHQQHQLQQHYHQQQQHLFAPYPNGPPPSYDAVVAQDELLASVVSARRKRSCPNAGTTMTTTNAHPPSPSMVEASLEPTGSSFQAEAAGEMDELEEGKLSCAGALQRKVAARARYGTRSHGRRRTANPASNDELAEDGATEPFWRSIELEEAERQEQQAAAVTAAEQGLSNCHCLARLIPGAPSGGPPPDPIYCRNCGYFVERETPFGGPSSPIDRSEVVQNNNNNNNNDTLLVDYDATGPVESAERTGSSSSNNSGPQAANIDMLTMQLMSRCLDTMNNNDAADEPHCFPAPPSDVGEQVAVVVAVGPRSTNEVAEPRNSENNNVITGSSVTSGVTTCRPLLPEATTLLIDILERASDGPADVTQGRRGVAGNAPKPTVEDETNGNGATSRPVVAEEPTEASASGRRLGGNGLVRLDMSQIIDHTGLPTYEAALKLESSGYV